MYKLLSNLIIYRDIGGNTILSRLGDIFERFDTSADTPEHLRTEIFVEIRRLLELATKYGFDTNLWHNYLTYLIITDENPFSFTYEKAGKQEGSVNEFAVNDFSIFKKLFDYDFSKIEKELGINCFSVISNYKAISKREQIYNKNVSEKVRALSREIELAEDGDAVLDAVSLFYKNYGVGMFGLNKAFRLSYDTGALSLSPITNTL